MGFLLYCYRVQESTPSSCSEMLQETFIKNVWENRREMVRKLKKTYLFCPICSVYHSSFRNLFVSWVLCSAGLLFAEVGSWRNQLVTFSIWKEFLLFLVLLPESDRRSLWWSPIFQELETSAIHCCCWPFEAEAQYRGVSSRCTIHAFISFRPEERSVRCCNESSWAVVGRVESEKSYRVWIPVEKEVWVLP